MKVLPQNIHKLQESLGMSKTISSQCYSKISFFNKFQYVSMKFGGTID